MSSIEPENLYKKSHEKKDYFFLKNAWKIYCGKLFFLRVFFTEGPIKTRYVQLGITSIEKKVPTYGNFREGKRSGEVNHT